MALSLRRILLGRPLATARAAHERLPKRLALAIFSSDALSSTAYATEEILRVLLATGVHSLRLAWPIGLGIATLLLIVAFSYRQTIFAYPSGGGAYIVAKDNLGETPGLIAAASLLIDYILTVSVSVAAGVAALVSAYNSLQPATVWLCLGFVILVMVANLRGLKESGSIFAIPTYTFIFSLAALVLMGLYQTFTQAPVTNNPVAREAVEETLREHGGVIAPLSLFLILRAFSSGCTALSGIEAISNAIPAFKKPESRNAATTLLWMAGILTSLFLGVTAIANHFQIPALPENSGHFETVISQLARTVLGGKTWFYYVIQYATMTILVVAANTAYSGFPLLASLLARDRYLPRQLADLGDRLVFNNGIVVLTFFACVLLVIFKGSVTSLIPLYAVGVFTSFTLSQAGMVRRWFQERGPGWAASAFVNLLGALATGIVTVVIGVTKFNAGVPLAKMGDMSINYGAWLVIGLIPLLVLLFRKVHLHYADVARHLVTASLPRISLVESIPHTVVVLVPGLHKGIFPALEYARSLSANVRALYIETDPANTPSIKEEWERHVNGISLVILESPYRTLREPLVEYILEVNAERADDELTVVIPELVATTKWWHRVLHNTSANAIRRALAQWPGVVITSYRYFAEEPPTRVAPETGVEVGARGGTP